MRADRLDEVVREAAAKLLQTPEVIPQLHERWAKALQEDQAGLGAEQAQLKQRRERLGKHIQNLVDAYHAESDTTGIAGDGLKIA